MIVPYFNNKTKSKKSKFPNINKKTNIKVNILMKLC